MQCAPRALIDAPGYYSEPAYTPDGTQIIATRRPIDGSISNYGKEYFRDDQRLSELVVIPAAGGVPAVITSAGREAYLGGFFLPGNPEYYFRYRLILPKQSSNGDYYVTGELQRIAINRVMTPQTILSVRFIKAGKRPWRDYVTVFPFQIAMSPDGQRAVVQAGFNELYVLDLPPLKSTGNVITVDLNDRLLRPLSPKSVLPESLSWTADGTMISYTSGSTLYLQSMRLKGASVRYSKPERIPIRVTVRRNQPAGTVAFRNARLVTMRYDEVIDSGDVVITNGRITGLGPSGSIEIPRDAFVVDAAGKTLLPGLFDLHAHLELPVEPVETTFWRLDAHLAFGVLTVREPQTASLSSLSYADLIAAGVVRGPHYLGTGRGIGLDLNDWTSTEQKAREIVRRYADEYRAEYLKEYLLGERSARQLLVMAAAEARLNVTSHGSRRLKHLIMNAIDGYGGFEHSVAFAPLYADVREFLAATGITWAENNWTARHFFPFFSDQLDMAVRDTLTHIYPSTSRADASDTLDFLFTPAASESSYVAWKMAASLANLVNGGVRMSPSSHGNFPGINTHFQIWAYVQGGMSELEALRAATLGGARALGLDAELGSLQVGKRGEVILVDGNPLDSIRNSASVVMVVTNGQLIRARDLSVLYPASRSQITN